MLLFDLLNYINDTLYLENISATEIGSKRFGSLKARATKEEKKYKMN